MDLIYMNENREDIGVLQDYSLDLAFGADENNFECQVQAVNHCCKKDYMLYMEGTEYGGIVDGIGVDTEHNAVTYSGRTWHGILGSKVIMPLMEGEKVTKPTVKLPDGYTVVEYIEATGTQYIDTGFTPNQDTRVVVEAMFAAASSTQVLFGSRLGGTELVYSFQTTSNRYVSRYYNNEQVIKESTLDGKFTVDKNKNVVTMAGDYTKTHSYTAFTCPGSMYLFACYSNGTVYGRSNAKLYSCQIYDNGALVRDFVPCINASGVAGLYDTVNAQFYTNAGTGSFTFGYIPGKLPDNFTPIEYIETTGTQYIDTGFVPNQDSRIVVEFMYLDGNNVYGARASVSSRNFAFRVISSAWQPGYGSTLGSTGIASDKTNWHVADQNKNVFLIDGEVGYTFTAETFTAPKTISLGAISGTNQMYYGKNRYRACKIYDNDTLIRDYTPCMSADGEAGLFDLVNAQFYTNAGTDVFVTGNVIERNEENGEEENTFDIDIITQNSKGESFVNRYLVLTGDAHECIKYILYRCGLSTLFAVPKKASGINITEYQFDRFIDAYKGLRKMLASANRLLHFSFNGSTVILSAEPIHDYSKDEEFDSDLLDFEMVRQENKVNHLICLGGGELENRLVRHLYVDADGKIGETQTFFGLEEYAVIYDYANVESEEELLKAGREKLKELHDTDSLDIDFEAEDDLYNVGDIVGAVDNVTGISIAAEIVKKIIQIKDGRTIISYEVGD